MMEEALNNFDLEAFLPYRLNRAAERMSMSFSRAYRERYGMTRPEWRVLANLGQYGQLTAREICTLSTQHKTKVSRAVAALEKRGWLTRHPNPDDRREEWLALTQSGRRAFRDIAATGMRHDRELFARLGSDNARALLAALDALEGL